ncbi:MAG: hypothetical protein QXH99_01985 [Sulfolobales archaeon]
MGGLVGVVAFDELWSVSKFMYYGLLASHNRGDNYVVVLSNGRDLKSVGGDITHLLLNKDSLDQLEGYVGIGGVYSQVDRLDGKYTHLSDNGYELSLLVDGYVDGSVLDIGRRLLKLVNLGYKLVEAFVEVIKGVRGVYSLLLINDKSEVIAYRSVPGLTPLHLGGYGFDLALIATESVPINILGGELRSAVKPGEYVYLSPDLVTVGEVPTDGVVNHAICAFEYIYMARHDSVLDGIDVYSIRKSLGEELGRRFKYDVDVVVGVPETAIPYALGFAKVLGKDLEYGFISTGVKVRTAIKGDPLERLIGIQLKLNPVRYVFSGRRVAIVDDSLVRGLTIKNVIQILRNKLGVKEVHVVIGSPKLITNCPYGKEIPPKDELLTANLSDELAVKYVEADSITWLSVDEVSKVFSGSGMSLCTGCFLGGCLVRGGSS